MFIKKPIINGKMSHRKMIFGIGINDADYKVNYKINGKQFYCPLYRKWYDMMWRCYSPQAHKTSPTYTDCTVDKRWHKFSAFREWMIKQDWQGKHLDKDIILPGNKIYSSETCCFVTSKVNAILGDCAKARGKYPLGVTLKRKKYNAKLRIDSKRTDIGVFETPESAHQAYCKEKEKYIRNTANEIKDIKIKKGLLRHADLFKAKSVA